MRNRYLTMLVAALLLGAGAPAGTVAAPTDQATGSAKNARGDDMNVSAHGVLTDARGHVTLYFGSVGFRTKGDVNCLNVVGNRAAVSGTLNETLPGFPSFTDFILLLEDNGSGRKDPPDRFVQIISNGPSDNECGLTEFDAFALSPVVQGNIELKNRVGP